MKKIMNILGISAAMLLVFTSCEDWLDMPSESKADSSTVFETVGRAEMTVMGGYSWLHTQELGYQLLMGTDESASTESNSKYNVANYDYTNTSSMLSSTYTNMYKAIEYANVCIKNLPEMNVSDGEKKKVDALLGEALAIRAYAYWNIVRFYGDVPYTNIPTVDLTTFSSSRVSRDTIYMCVQHGTYSIKIVDPLKFYAEAVPKNKDHVEIDEINEQYLSEFLEALQSSVNQMSADGFRISFVSSKARELGKYMSSVLDEEWNQTRGMEIQAVGMTVSYSEESQKLLNMRNEGAMLSDPTVREGYVQGAVARGLEAAGSNSNGSMAGFMGMGMASNISGGMMGAASNVNLQQMQMMNGGAPAGMTQGAVPAIPPAGQEAPQAPQAPAGWTCACGQQNQGKFCSNCGKPAPKTEWTCSCGQVNSGNFCSNCGKPRT